MKLKKLIFTLIFGCTIQVCHAELPLLNSSGNQITDQDSHQVILKGVNLGSLFPMEPYMSPVPKSESDREVDSWSIMNDLQKHYGLTAAEQVTDVYQRAWINEEDIENIHSAGFNVIRIPVWWGQFYDITNVSPTGWRDDAFGGLDRIVNAARQAGIYSIIDMHGAVDSQSFNASTGRANYNHFWSDKDAQQATEYMWQKIAEHYASDNAIAGYDLLNEPDARASKSEKWSENDIQSVVHIYDRLYKAIREVDSRHIVFIEDTFDKWNLDMLPAPSEMGWQNVVYEIHIYPWPYQQRSNETHLEQVQRETSKALNDIEAHKNWNVPVYVGEFNALDSNPDAWKAMTSAFENTSLSWTMWSYKSSNSPVPNYWGLYDRKGWSGTPVISGSDSSDVQRVWSKWTTSSAFSPNVDLIGILTH